MSKDLNKMLTSPTKGVPESKGALARLYRQILTDLNITPLTFQTLMKRYLNDPRNGFAGNGKMRSSERGNLIKEIRRPDMTWKVFQKCIQFLDPVEVEFEVRLKWRGGRTTAHTLTVKNVDQLPDKLEECLNATVSENDDDDNNNTP